MRTWTSCDNCGTVNNLRAYNEDRVEWMLIPPGDPFVDDVPPPKYNCYNCGDEM